MKKNNEYIVKNWIQFGYAVITKKDEFTVVNPKMVKTLVAINKIFKK